MAKVHGKDASVFIREFDISGDGNRISLTISPETAEITGFQDGAKQHVEGLYGWGASMEGYWNSATSQVDPTLFQLIGQGTQVIGIWPNGIAIGKLGYEGYGVLTNYSPEDVISGAVVFSGDFVGGTEVFRVASLDDKISTTVTAVGTVTGDVQNLGTSSFAALVGILRVTGTPTGTIIATVQGGTTEATVGRDLLTLTTTSSAGVELQRIGTIAADIGPFFRSSVWTAHTGAPSVNYQLSVGVHVER